jgi:hypothetical protein
MPGWAHPYHNPFVLYADGGDPEPEPADDPDPAPEPEPDPEPVDDWQPPTREEWEQHQASLKRASAEAANRRKWMKAAGLDPKTGQKLEPDPEPEPIAPKPQDPAAAPPPGLSDADVKRAVDRAVTETQLRGRRQMHSFTVGFNQELAKAGWNGSRLGHLMKLLDFDDIDIDDDGEITGLAEQIDGLKTDWPEFFKRQRAVPSKSPGGSGQNGAPAGNVDTADKKPPAPEPKDWAVQVAEKLRRG